MRLAGDLGREREDVSGDKGCDKPLSPIYFPRTVGTRSLTSEGVPKEFRECTEVDPRFQPYLILSCRGCGLL